MPPAHMASGERFAQLADQPHLWLLTLDPGCDKSWAARHESLLSDHEQRRYNRYQRSDDRQLFLVAHVFLRKTLSRYASITPQAWTFTTNRHGRPEIANAEAPSGLRFNLAHTAGMVAILVHNEADGGVDVEHLGNVADPVALSQTVFANDERADWLALADDRHELGFYRLWTLKEAFIKAKGKGLAIPLKEFAFTGIDTSEIQVTCAAAIDEQPGAWHFTWHQPSPRFVVATAYRAGTVHRRRSVLVQEVTWVGADW